MLSLLRRSLIGLCGAVLGLACMVSVSRSDEVSARVSALGRRFPEEAPIKLQIGDLVLNLVDRKLYRGPRRIELSARELMLLRVLMREPGRIFSRTELCERVWEREHEYGLKLVEAYISRLRKKINSPLLIHTVRHMGYTIREPE